MSSYIEAGLNIVLSVSLVNRFGLVGVAVGTLISMTYRMLYLVLYLSRNIVYRSLKTFAKHIFVDFLSLGTIMGMGIISLNMYQINTLVDWVMVAVILGVISLFLLSIINLIFYKDTMVSAVRGILKRN